MRNKKDAAQIKTPMNFEPPRESAETIIFNNKVGTFYHYPT
jgi:hypothetical protein